MEKLYKVSNDNLQSAVTLKLNEKIAKTNFVHYTANHMKRKKMCKNGARKKGHGFSF